MIDVDVEIDDFSLNEALKEQIDPEALWEKRFPPRIIYIDAEYARYIEKGTRPMNSAGRKRTDGKGMRGKPPRYSEAQDRIATWVRDKLGVSDYKEWRRASYMIFKHIAENGIAPTHFAESAINETLAAIDRGEWDFMDPDVTSDTIASYAEDMIQHNLANPRERIDGSIDRDKIDWTGHLLSSVHVEHAPPGYPTISVNILMDEDDVAVRYQEELEGERGGWEEITR